MVGAATWHNLVRQALQKSPDLIVAQVAQPDAEIFEALRSLQAMHPLPVLLFTQSPDADRIERALQVGVAVHVVNGYAAARLRPLAHLAIARFRRDQDMRRQLHELEQRFEERRLVDRAKGVLMRARQIPEDEAFRMLRAASMHANVRVGQVSQQVIDAAHFADAVNRAGQLRMFGQQLVKHAALRLLATDPAADDARIAELLRRGEPNLAELAKGLSRSTYGDLVDAVRRAWQQLAQALERPLERARLAEVDRLAETMLQDAERLTMQLENAGLAAPLRVVNLSGRQRMLSQRLAKQLLLGGLLDGAAAAAARRDAAATAAAFTQALAELEKIPLSSSDIRADLAEARRLWQALLEAGDAAGSAAGQHGLRRGSEALLELFERLTRRYEHSVQMLIG